MKRLMFLAAVSAVVLAKPELYKEQEDFQYSRSSTDEGSKSGFYGAQRGNMGGNYERAHNMDSLAQNQMSGLVRQVEGELGDGAKMRSGNVYSAANSKGIYGSGHFDLSNLAGRNFHEGTYYDNSQSRSTLAQTSSRHSSADYSNSNSHSYSNSGYRGYQGSDAQTQTDDLQSLDNLKSSNQYNYGRQSSGFHSQAGFQEHGEYDNNANSNAMHSSNIRTRLISATPVKIILTPGGRVAIPVAAQTYDAAHGASASEQNFQNRDSAVISNQNQGYIPSNAKHYESSYRYHKKWEKHDTIPTSISVVLPTEEPIPRNSELLEDREARLQHNYNTRGLDSQSEHSSSASGRYIGVKSSSSQSRYQSNLDTQYHGDSSSSNANLYNQLGYHAGSNHDASNFNSHSNLNANSQTNYNAGSLSDLNSQVENLDTKPKSYQSSYSYHKSWERQGDPYVIKPVSGRLYDSQASQRITSNQGYAAYGSGSHYSHNQADCDENSHIRVARSSYTENDMQQQNQNLDDSNELVQQVQSTWQNLGDLSQQSQNNWDQQNVGQQSENQWETLEDLNQQVQNKWNQQTQNLDQSNVEQQSQNTWNHQTQNLDQSNVEQQSQNKWDNLQDFNQQSQNHFEQNSEQQTQNQWNNIEALGQQSQSTWEPQNVGQESQSQWDTFENLGYQSHKNWGGQTLSHNTYDDITQQHQTSDINSENLRKDTNSFREEPNQDSEHQKALKLNPHNTESYLNAPGVQGVPHKVENPWDKFDILDANKNNKPINEHKIEDSGFYWHHIPNNGVEDQQINKLNANGDIISDLGQRNINTNPMSEYGKDYAGLESNYNNQNVHYSYSNGFVNPTIYNKRNFNPEYLNLHNAETHNSGNVQIGWQEHNTDSNSFSQANNFQNQAQDSKISSFWDKFKTIEKESTFSTSDLSYITKQSENKFSLGNIDRREEATFEVTQTEKSLSSNISSDSQKPYKESETVPPKGNKQSVSDIELPEEIESSNNKEPETNADIGRGDIGADDSYNLSEIMPTVTRSDNIPEKLPTYNTKPFVDNNNGKTDDSKLNVSSVELKISREGNISTRNPYLSDNITDTTQNNKANQTRFQINLTDKISDSIQNNKIQHGIDHNDKRQQDQYNKLQNRDTTERDSFEKDRLNLQNGGQYLENSFHHNLDLAGQNKNIEHNFELHNGQEFEQQLTNLEQQNSENLDQQDFKQQNQYLEQQNLHDFEQNNEQSFVQQHFNEEQNLQNFVQENVQDFAQENQNMDQQSLYNFGDQVPQQFEQNVQNMEQENENQQSLQQETVPHFWTEKEQLAQEHLQDFNIRTFKLQKPNVEQQNYRSIDIHNENISHSDQLHQLENPVKQEASNITEELAVVIPKRITDLEQTQPKIKEKLEEKKQETVVETATENVGFWKSVGGKLSNAKNKVVSWFKNL